MVKIADTPWGSKYIDLPKVFKYARVYRNKFGLSKMMVMVRRREEEYVEVIYRISKEKGYARVKDVSEELGVTLSTVSEMFRKLGEKGYINYEKYGVAILTEKGKKLALSLERKHSAIREFFIILGLDERVADENACKMEHIVTREVMDRIAKFVEFIKAHEEPKWVERFKEYCKTGKISPCPKTKKS